MRWVTESKRIEVQVGKVLSFKSQVGKVKTGQTIGGLIGQECIDPFGKINQLINQVN